MKLGLGTVQFGMNYGISNKNGVTTSEEVKNILQIAERNNVTNIDTASLYGDSEQVLGTTLGHDHKFHIITKTPRLSIFQTTNDKVKELKVKFNDSLFKLKSESVYGLMLHDGNDLIGDDSERIFETLLDLKKSGLVQKIGASVYSEEEITSIIDKYPIDIIQIPINIFDQRLLKNGILNDLKERGIEIHARSAFLQGLVFISPPELDSRFSDLVPTSQKLYALAHQLDVPVAALCLGFLKSLSQIDSIICGVNTGLQFEELIKFINFELPQINYSQFAIDNEFILNPSQWNKKNDRERDNNSRLQ